MKQHSRKLVPAIFSILVALGTSLLALASPALAFADQCKPASLEVGAGDVWVFEHACTTGDVGFYRETYTSNRAGASLRLEVSSLDYPDQKQKLDAAIKKHFLDGLNDIELDFFYLTVIPILENAASSNPDEREQLLKSARDQWAGYLAKEIGTADIRYGQP